MLIPLGSRYLLPPGALAQTFQDHSGWVIGALLLEDGKRALSWADDGTLRLWDLDKGQSQALEGQGQTLK
ncbi:MAG: hypothetical protein ACR2QH_03995, partial [Geminicoccaceae bacterium]